MLVVGCGWVMTGRLGTGLEGDDEWARGWLGGDEGSGVTVFVFVVLVGGQGGRSNVFASSCGVCAILGGS